MARRRRKRYSPKSMGFSRAQLLNELIDHIPDVIYFKDRKGYFILVNQAHAKGVGLRPEQVIGKTDFDFFTRRRAEAMVRDDRRVMKTAEPIIDKIERATRPDGVDNYVSTTKIPRCDKNGKVIGIMGITRDITRRMQMVSLQEDKARIEKKLKSLEEINRLKTDFVSVVSHELRTPLAVLKEAVTLLADRTAGTINELQKEILSRADDNVDRLNKIINDLLDISRIEKGKLILRYSLTDLKDLITENAGYFLRLAKDKGIYLEYKLPKNQINLFMDAERINQVITNLLNNAIKFTEEGGSIFVRVEPLQSSVRVSVSDTGVGIPDEDIHKLFKKFTQVTEDLDARRRGVGLGLSISKELIQRHGGTMWVESRLGVGSRFYFTLPLFLTERVLPQSVRDVIDSLLKGKTHFYLINMLIVVYERFREEIGKGYRILVKGIHSVVEDTCEEFVDLYKMRPHISLSDMRRGRFNIIVTGIDEQKATKLCNIIKDRVNRYLKRRNVKEIFTNLGILSYPRRLETPLTRNVPVNLHIKNMYIGPEGRRLPRVYYKLNINILTEDERAQACETIDISTGGLCFMSKAAMEVDSRITISINLPDRKKPVVVQARVAWIKSTDTLSEAMTYHRIGLEFIRLSKRNKGIVADFVKHISDKSKIE